MSRLLLVVGAFVSEMRDCQGLDGFWKVVSVEGGGHKGNEKGCVNR